MPRFAADLVVGSPLQPIKTTTAPMTVMKPEVLGKSDPKTVTSSTILTNDAPAVFDWSSSGLVNPLDGENINIFLKTFFVLVFSLILSIAFLTNFVRKFGNL